MKEYNININVNRAGAVCVVAAILTGAGMLIYYAENGFLPSFRDGGFEFIPVNNKKQILESIPA